MKKQRNLVLCFDGTWNKPEQLDKGIPAPTNVVKFEKSLAHQKGKQRKYYEEGVGAREWESLSGGVMGCGINKRIKGGYRWLQQRFADKGWNNKVFIFGFSRGAYIARRFAGLLAHSGIPVNIEDAELGWDLYHDKNTTQIAEHKTQGRFLDIPIEMVGVWDTVKATNDADYDDNLLSANVKFGYHAMAIDERRKPFPVLKWDDDARVQQIWFGGVHADIGGGYARAGLSDIALRWMIDCAMKHGLKFKFNYVKNNINPKVVKPHESYEGKWLILGDEIRTIQNGSLFHSSLKELMKRDDYSPTNLPGTFNFTNG